jgi:Flp pilus assembly protein TadD
MKRLALSAAALSLLVLGACATTGPTAEEAQLRPAQPAAEGRSGYGQFLAGQAAQADGRNEEASGYFARARAAGAEVGSLKERAFQAALFAGNVPEAARLAPTDGEGVAFRVRMGQLTRAVEDMASGNGALAKTILVEQGIGFPHRQASVLLAPWAAAAAGDLPAAVARPTLRGDRLVEVFGLLNQALLYERAKRFDEAETNFKILMTYGDASVIFAHDYGAFLERRKRGADAVAVYDAALAIEPGDRELSLSRNRAVAGGKPPAMLSIRQGAARALLTPAASMATEKQYELALSYLNLAARLDPDREDIWIQMGDVYANMGDPDNARTAFSRVKPGSSASALARSRLAWSFQSAGEHDKALKLAEEAAAQGDRNALVNYADILRANERYSESAVLLDRILQMDGQKTDWRLLYLRAVARERSGDWTGAEADLLVALKMQPEEPELLNFLGYSWIDRGERLAEATAMVQKAVAANPRSGAMIDSLGWAYFRLGDYRNAVENLEQAVLLEPADPDINDHLGDAYWQVGRRIEARFQWTRALQLKPSDSLKQKIERKLETGLEGVKPVVVQR